MKNMRSKSSQSRARLGFGSGCCRPNIDEKSRLTYGPTIAQTGQGEKRGAEVRPAMSQAWVWCRCCQPYTDEKSGTLFGITTAKMVVERQAQLCAIHCAGPYRLSYAIIFLLTTAGQSLMYAGCPPNVSENAIKKKTYSVDQLGQLCSSLGSFATM